MNTSPARDCGGLYLRGPIEIQDVAPIQPMLREYVVSHPAPVLDLLSVKSCDAAGAQLLLSAAKTATAAGKTIQFQSPSPALLDAWLRLGLPENFFTHPSA